MKEEKSLKKEISEVENELSNSYNMMEFVSDEGIVDFYIYLIKAYEAKHKYLLRKLKEI